jgi:hypothetical protein
LNWHLKIDIHQKPIVAAAALKAGIVLPKPVKLHLAS